MSYLAPPPAVLVKLCSLIKRYRSRNPFPQQDVNSRSPKILHLGGNVYC